MNVVRMTKGETLEDVNQDIQHLVAELNRVTGVMEIISYKLSELKTMTSGYSAKLNTVDRDLETLFEIAREQPRLY